MATYLPRTIFAALVCAVFAPFLLYSQSNADSLSVLRIVNIHSEVTHLAVTSTYVKDTVVRELGFPSVSQRLAYPGSVTDTLTFISTASGHSILGRQALNIAAGRYYSVLLLPIGSQAFVQPYYRDIHTKVPDGKAYVQFLHGAADVGALSASLTDAGGQTIAFGVPGFGTLTAYDTTITPGAFDITIKTASDARVIFEGHGFFEAGTFQTLILSGLESASSIGLGIFDQDDTTRQDPIRAVERTSMSVVSGEEDAGNAVSLSVSPNPLRNGSQLSLVMKKPETVSIDLYDLRGEKRAVVFQGSVSVGETRFDLSSVSVLEGGFYVLAVSSAEGCRLATLRLLVDGA